MSRSSSGAGGSKASIKFFHGVMGAMSNAEQERQALSQAKAKADAGGGQ